MCTIERARSNKNLARPAVTRILLLRCAIVCSCATCRGSRCANQAGSPPSSPRRICRKSALKQLYCCQGAARPVGPPIYNNQGKSVLLISYSSQLMAAAVHLSRLNVIPQIEQKIKHCRHTQQIINRRNNSTRPQNRGGQSCRSNCSLGCGCQTQLADRDPPQPVKE